MRPRLLVAAGLFSMVVLSALAQGRGPGYGREGVSSGPCWSASALPKQLLSPAETDRILYMREEEKLARDVYRSLFQKWESNIFARIANSEQRHMDAIAVLISKYGLPDPVADDTPGVFANAKLGALYTEMMARGTSSLEEALWVGAMIEDLDIYDLNEALREADNEDLTLVFGNLNRGSRNHLQAFTRQLERFGVSYEPQFITAAEYDSITSSSQESGRGRARRRAAVR